MKRTQLFTAMVAVLAVGFVSANALADEGVIRAKVSYGLASYTSPSANSDIKSNYSTLGLGVTYIWPSNIFADFSTKMTGSGASYNAASVTAGSPSQVTSDQSFSRTENTLTVGMPLENGMQGNVGLFTADTVFKLSQYGQFSQKMTGITGGAGMGFPLDGGKSGVVGVNGALALLNASNTSANGNVSSSNLSYGLSVGAAYNYPINKNVSVSADAKFQSYLIKYSTFSGDERILSTALSLIGQF